MIRKSDIETLSDEMLCVRYAQTEELKYIVVLYKRYMHLIYGICLKYLGNREDSKDATNHIFEILVTKVKRHQIKYFKSWLYIVCKNHCLTEMRKESSAAIISTSPDMEIGDIPHLNDDLEEKLILEQKLDSLEECMKVLTAQQKTCVDLFYLQKKSYREITDATQYALQKVKSYIQNGKRSLKKCIENNG